MECPLGPKRFLVFSVSAQKLDRFLDSLDIIFINPCLVTNNDEFDECRVLRKILPKCVESIHKRSYAISLMLTRWFTVSLTFFMLSLTEVYLPYNLH